MKRVDFVRHLARNGCTPVREGGKHSVYCNPATGSVSSIPRHSEVNNFLARKICRDLGVPEAKRK